MRPNYGNIAPVHLILALRLRKPYADENASRRALSLRPSQTPIAVRPCWCQESSAAALWGDVQSAVN